MEKVSFKRKLGDETAVREETDEAIKLDTDQEAHQQMNKSQHHFLIAAWMIATFGQAALRSRGGGYVVDVAGGLGKLDYELSVRYGVPSVLIDPKFSTAVGTEDPDQEPKKEEEKEVDERISAEEEEKEEEEESHDGARRRSTLQLSSMLRRKMKKVSRSRAAGCSAGAGAAREEDRSPLMGMLRLSGLQVQDDGLILPRVSRSIEDSSMLPFEHITKHFPLSHADISSDPHLSGVLCNASFIIGVHPDQVTESIVDIAIYLRIPFAVIPCCVFTKLFPARLTPSGEAVRTYEELVAYLKAKHRNITQGILPFYGRNIVLYCTSYDD